MKLACTIPVMSYLSRLGHRLADGVFLARFMVRRARSEFVVLDHDALGSFISVADEVLYRVTSDQQHPQAARPIVVIFPREAPNETCRSLFLRAMSRQQSVLTLDSRGNSAVYLLERALRKMNRTWGSVPASILRSWTRTGLDARAVRDTDRPYIQFTPEETEHGWAALAELGIGPDTDYVCFSVRDRAYLTQRYQQNSPHGSSSHSQHDYRNPPLESYRRSIERLLGEGLTVVRTGRIVEQGFAVDHPNFVAYAGSEHWTDFLDLFLYANCRFALHGGSSGIDSLAATFRKPLCLVDVVPWLHTLCSTSTLVITPALLKEVRSGRILSLREMVASFRSRTSDYDDLGLSIVRHSDAEIDCALQELQSRLAGEWVSTSQDEQMQELFWAAMPDPLDLYEPLGCSVADGRGTVAVVGTGFLRDHARELLGAESRSCG